MTEELESLQPEDIEFTRKNAERLYSSGEARSINPNRWERVRKDIRFDDVVLELTGLHGHSISCPFHGRDSRPSFYLYRGSNDGWCFGCPPKQQYYDSVRFVSKSLNISRVQALKWIERKFDLEPLPDVILEEEAGEVVSQIKFEDLREPFIALARKDILANKDPELAEEYLRLYFTADKLAAQDTTEEEKAKAALLLAQVLGREVLKRIKLKKAF